MPRGSALVVGRSPHALDRKLCRDLWRRRGQGIAVAVVVACGVATAVMSFSVLRSLDETRLDYYKRDGFADVFANVVQAPTSVADVIARSPGVAYIETRLVKDVALDLDDLDAPAVGRFISLPVSGIPALNFFTLRRGRLPSSSDEVVASESFVMAHGFAPGDHLVAVMNGARRRLTIVGVALSPEYVYALGPGQIVPDDRRFGIFWMRQGALATAFDFWDSINDISVALEPSASEEAVIERLDQSLRPYGSPGAYGRAHQYSDAFLRGELDQLVAIGRLVPPIFLGVAAFLLHAVLRRIIDVEREQIGLLKALGFSDGALGRHYLKFALVLSGLGIVVGLVVGVLLGQGLTAIYAQFFHFPVLRYRPDMLSMAGAALIALAVSVTGVIDAIHRVVRLPVAAAMAPAAPTVYRTVPGERLLMFLRLGQPARMIFRHLARRPLRAALTLSGVALAVALPVATLFSFEALDYMVDVFYPRAQRQDVTVLFNRTQPGAVLDEIRHWPGVQAVEGIRVVPVRLSAGSYSRLVTLNGIPSDATLVRLLDADLTPIAVPAQGLALSTKLAALLHVGVGDPVTVRLAARDVVLPVARLTEQYIGLGAYLELSALNQLLDEGAAISGVEVQIGHEQRALFFRALKDAPVVASVVLKASTVNAFRQTMARTLTLIVSFFVLFAALTAVGLVYSTAQITLSERGRELALMRALGFSGRQVGAVLFGELALLVLAGLPLGCVLGHALGWVIVRGLDSDLFRVPLVIGARTYTAALAIVVVASLTSSWAVARQLARVDIVATLKTRE
jgi:putative ABC transport system permease protein